jgi:hypothetical protein
MAQDFRIAIAIAKAKAKKGKLIKKQMRAIHPDNVPTKKDFECKPFKY